MEAPQGVQISTAVSCTPNMKFAFRQLTNVLDPTDLLINISPPTCNQEIMSIPVSEAANAQTVFGVDEQNPACLSIQKIGHDHNSRGNLRSYGHDPFKSIPTTPATLF